MQSSLSTRADFKPKLLIVDDTRNIIRVFHHHYRETCQITKVYDFFSAASFIQKEEFDLFFIDIGLPDGSGYDLVRKIRKNPKNNEKPVFVITANNSKQAKERSLLEGADDVVIKPFQFLELDDKIRQIFTGIPGRTPNFLRTCPHCRHMITKPALICRFCKRVTRNKNLEFIPGGDLKEMVDAENLRGEVRKEELNKIKESVLRNIRSSGENLSREQIGDIQNILRLIRLENDHHGLSRLMESNSYLWKHFQGFLGKTVFGTVDPSEINFKMLLRVDFAILKQVGCYVYLKYILNKNPLPRNFSPNIKDFFLNFSLASYHLSNVHQISNVDGYTLGFFYTFSHFYIIGGFNREFKNLHSPLSLSEYLECFNEAHTLMFNRIFSKYLHRTDKTIINTLGTFKPSDSFTSLTLRQDKLLAGLHLVMAGIFNFKVFPPKVNKNKINFCLEALWGKNKLNIEQNLKRKILQLSNLLGG